MTIIAKPVGLFFRIHGGVVGEIVDGEHSLLRIGILISLTRGTPRRVGCSYPMNPGVLSVVVGNLDTIRKVAHIALRFMMPTMTTTWHGPSAKCEVPTLMWTSFSSDQSREI